MREPRLTLNPEHIKLVAEIDEFKGKWEALKLLSPDRLSALRKVATIESVGSSTRIEGAKLTNAQVEELLSGLAIKSFLDRDEQEVAGYAEVMDLIFEAHGELRITENHIRQLHQILLKHSTKDERHRGAYKTLSNSVAAFDSNGREIGIVFQTTSPFDTPREMEALVGWTRKAMEEGTHHPLLTIAVFIVSFLAIHPFQDGNGRLSRVLTTLLLLRSGYAYVTYASLERVIEENKDTYYQALRRTQTSINADVVDWKPWLGFFLRSLKKQKDTLSSRLDRERQDQDTDSDLSMLSRQILRFLAERGQLSSSQLAEITASNRNTLKVRLRELISAGNVQRHGKGRATWYVLSAASRTTKP